MKRLARRFLSLRDRLAWRWRRTGFRISARLLELAGRVESDGARIQDAPLRCDGAGLVRLGASVMIGYSLAPRTGDGEVTLQARYPASRIEVGGSTVFSNNVTIIAVDRVVIGRHCLLGDHVLVLDSDFHHVEPKRRNEPNPPTDEVVIGDNVWLGSRVTVLKGCTIGENSVVAAGAVVTASIPANSVAAGVPAKVIRSLS